MKESLGCRDAQISEGYLTLAFSDRIECWNLEQNEKTLEWSMEIKTPSEESGIVYRLKFYIHQLCLIYVHVVTHPVFLLGPSLDLPLVPGGYIALKPPLYRSLSPQLKAVSLVLGAEHAILLSATGAVYSWGNGR